MDDAIQLVLETFPCWISGASTDTKPMVGADAKACRIHGNGNKSHGSADHQQVLNGCQPARAIDAALRSAAQICFLTEAATPCTRLHAVANQRNTQPNMAEVSLPINSTASQLSAKTKTTGNGSA